MTRKNKACLAPLQRTETKGKDFPLFGSYQWPQNDTCRSAQRTLDDEELDSGDEEDRNDRMADDALDDGEMVMDGHSANIMDVKLGRHAVPDPSDGEVCCNAVRTSEIRLY